MILTKLFDEVMMSVRQMLDMYQAFVFGPFLFLVDAILEEFGGSFGLHEDTCLVALLDKYVSNLFANIECKDHV